jgi:hypothetical protein
MDESQKKELGEQEQEASNGEEEQGVAEVRDAHGRVRGWSSFGVGKEEGLVFGTDGGPEDGHGDGGFLGGEGTYGG